MSLLYIYFNNINPSLISILLFFLIQANETEATTSLERLYVGYMRILAVLDIILQRNYFVGIYLQYL